MAAAGLEVRLTEERAKGAVATHVTKMVDTVVNSLDDIDRVYLLAGDHATWKIAGVGQDHADFVFRLEGEDASGERSADDLFVPVQALIAGARTLQLQPGVPQLFASSTVRKLARLATPDKGIQGVTLSTYNGQRGPVVHLDEAVRANARATVEQARIARGSVHGTLISLGKTTGRTTVHVAVHDPQHKRAIDGYAPESMAEDLREAWLHRVALGGMVHRNNLGQAIRVDIDRMMRLPDDNTGRSSVEDLFGVAQHWLDGETTVDDLIGEARRDRIEIAYGET